MYVRVLQECFYVLLSVSKDVDCAPKLCILFVMCAGKALNRCVVMIIAFILSSHIY